MGYARWSFLVLVASVVGCGGRLHAGASEDAGAVDLASGADSSSQPGPDAGNALSGPDYGNASVPGAAASSAWTPDAIRSRLAFWFDPTSMVEVSGQVSRWVDLSGHGNDAIQDNPTYQPVVRGQGIGGFPSVGFDGPITFLSIADQVSMQWGTGDFVVLAVVRATQATAVNAMLYQKTGLEPYDGVNLYLNAGKPVLTSLAAAQVSGAVYVVSAPPPSTFVDSTVRLVGARRTGGTIEIRVDGKVSGSITNASVAADVSAVGWSGNIGQNGYGTPGAENQQLHGDLAEEVAVRGSLTLEELSDLEGYLKSRYGL